MMRTSALLLLLALGACGTDDAAPLDCEDNHRFDADAGVADPTVVFLPDGQPEARVRVATQRLTVRQDRLVWPKLCLLEFLPSVPEDDGALILFPFNAPWSYNTRDILVPTDFIFIRTSLTVLSVLPNVEPDGDGRQSDGDSRDLLLVNGGWAARHGVGPGTAVRFENVSP